jgi:hypothetical protein
MSDELIFIPFGAKQSEIVDVHALLVEDGHIDDDLQSSKMSNILRRVQSKAGTIVQGYDEGDDFIDDSEIVAMQGEVHTLDPNSFRVVLTYGSPASAKPTAPKARSDETSGEPQSIPDSLVVFLDRIKLGTFEAIDRQVERLNAGAKSVHMINLTNDVAEEIANCVDEKIRIESEKCGGNAAKRKIEQWKKDAFQLIYTHCFTARDYQFTTVRRLGLAYMKFKKESAKDQAEPEEELIKEAPAEPE